jgi:hypothetical protein
MTSNVNITDDELAVFYTPDAIREHFELIEEQDRGQTNEDDRTCAKWVARATEDELREIGLSCVWSDRTWQLFHELLVDAVTDYKKDGNQST